MVFGAGIMIWGLFGVLCLCSKKEQGNVFQRISMYIYKKISMWKMTQKLLVQNMQVTQNLAALHPGEMPEKLLSEYHVEKIRIVILMLLVGSGIACCVDISAGSEGILAGEGIIRRPTERQTVVLEATVTEGGERIRQEISLEVDVRVLTEEEVQKSYEEMIFELQQKIAGENVSLQEVRSDLYLPYEVEGYPFFISWKSSDHSLIAADGSVTTENLEAPVKVSLTAEALYGDSVRTHTWDVVLCPPNRTSGEQFLYDLKKAVKAADEEQQYEEELHLPRTIKGRNVSWQSSKDNSGSVVLLITFLAAGAVFYMKDKDLQDELMKRRREMRSEYVVVVSKYALFLEAGMTVRGAFVKICRDYYDKEHKKEHPLYEEMRYSCNELKAGISESKVYEKFGRRTGVQEYTKLCALLSQNLKKGNTALARRLKEECEDALAENLQWKKRQGEEAGTKLLAPMGMMLIMVLVLIMLPAFSGLGI